MSKLYVYLIPYMLFLSCSNIDNSNCHVIKQLIYANNNIPTLKIDYNQPKEKILLKIENQFNEDLCWKEVTFGLKLENRSIKCLIIKECYNGTILHRKRSEVVILMNQLEEILINDDKITTDGIKDWLIMNFPNDELNTESFNVKEVLFKWDEKVSKKSVEEAINEVVEAYKLIYETIAMKHFNKSICKLNKRETNELEELMPFRLRFKLGMNIPPPVIGNLKKGNDT